MLKVKGIEAGYGAIQVLKGIDLDVQKGEIVTLIGANGAGKTTLLRVVSGILTPTKGEVFFEGENIVKRAPHRIVRRGICLIQEGREILNQMTVLENLLMGGFVRPDEELKTGLDMVFQMFPVLQRRQGQLGKTLSGGEQQMLAIGRALMAQPKLYMMDEPSLGLAPMLVNEVFAKIEELRSEDIGILLVEQNARKAFQVADRGYVLEIGKIVLTGTGAELTSNEKVREAYLGGNRARRKDSN
ncbi:MAG: ABC transporter ATP-binding protein [Deltaproteobacteria bacterium]|nr:MAG: ABC transporter ATP-binding protein [Deltaproteobacteria bacterium]